MTNGDENTTDRIIRTAEPRDIEAIATALTEAFFDDPVWGPLFPDPALRRAQANQYWRFMVTEALRLPESVVAETPSGELIAVAVWFPPGAEEIREERVPAYEAMVRELLDVEQAEAMFASGVSFGAARPDAPHAYLTLLAVAPGWQGRGEGMGLLRTTLERYDAAGIPTYLESSNPANDARYERLGYLPQGLVTAGDGASAQTYWRDAAPAQA